VGQFRFAMTVYNRGECEGVIIMGRNRRPWIFGILFWLLFLISIFVGLNGHFPWLDTAWAFGRVLFVAVTSVLIIVEVSRSPDGSGEYVYYRGMPRFMRSLLMDDEQFAKDLEKRKVWYSKRKSK
jgi:hypothetical protein